MACTVCSDFLHYLLLVCLSCLLLIPKGGTVFYIVSCSAFIMVLLLSVIEKCGLFVNLSYM